MTEFLPGGSHYEQRKEGEARVARREQLSAHPWGIGPDAAEMGPGAAIPMIQPTKVRFIHAAGEFEEGGSDSHFDVELVNAVPRVGEYIEFPQWFYQYGCEVTEVHWMLGDESPADIVVLVES